MSTEVSLQTVSESDTGVRLDRWIKRRREIPHGQIEKLLRTGQIRVDGKRAKSNERLLAGSTVRLPPLPVTEQKQPRFSNFSQEKREFIRKLVIYQDEDIIALNKPSGLAVQGGTKTTEHIDGFLDILSENNERPKLVHRLDRDTSGVLLLARNTKTARKIGELFRAKEISKIYWAITVGVPNPKSGQLRSWMAKGPYSTSNSSKKRGYGREKMHLADQKDKNSVHAVTDYAVISVAAQKAAWVALRPQTGRTHQLRLHMSELGTSILGDRKYPCDLEVPYGLSDRLHLHSRTLIVPSSNNKPIRITAPLPSHIKETFATLGFLEEEASVPPEEMFA